MAKFGLAGNIECAADLVRLRPRDAQLHEPRRVDLLELGNRRHLAKQTPGVDPPLLKRAGVPGHLDGPTELRLDAFDELADLSRGAFCLFALDVDEGGLMLPVEEPDLRCTVG